MYLVQQSGEPGLNQFAFLADGAEVGLFGRVFNLLRDVNPKGGLADHNLRMALLKLCKGAREAASHLADRSDGCNALLGSGDHPVSCR